MSRLFGLEFGFQGSGLSVLVCTVVPVLKSLVETGFAIRSPPAMLTLTFGLVVRTAGLSEQNVV